ncbi:hypothetical protein BJ508DRAFT_315477 [Ascobolus immersus RN42]|uniref:Uncharacterized protein n=1 Tax=Ascobolus immersus RN42 TaxID=1160509 RepID=A0A3N4HD71_ASCIM|nr:hypothetical protein BJ508DRAFT_315477 [Ascobolus immersus RN42]
MVPLMTALGDDSELLCKIIICADKNSIIVRLIDRFRLHATGIDAFSVLIEFTSIGLLVILIHYLEFALNCAYGSNRFLDLFRRYFTHCRRIEKIEKCSMARLGYASSYLGESSANAKAGSISPSERKLVVYAKSKSAGNLVCWAPRSPAFSITQRCHFDPNRKSGNWKSLHFLVDVGKKTRLWVATNVLSLRGWTMEQSGTLEDAHTLQSKIKESYSSRANWEPTVEHLLREIVLGHFESQKYWNFGLRWRSS